MNLMNLLIRAAAVLALAVQGLAQVGDGSTWKTPSGVIVTAHVTVVFGMNQGTFSASYMQNYSLYQSSAVDATPDPGGGVNVVESDVAFTYNEQTVGGLVFRVHNGKLQVKVKGVWKNCAKWSQLQTWDPSGGPGGGVGTVPKPPKH